MQDANSVYLTSLNAERLPVVDDRDSFYKSCTGQVGEAEVAKHKVYLANTSTVVVIIIIRPADIQGKGIESSKSRF